MNTENNTRESETPAQVPFAFHESALAFARETITRLWIALLALIIALVVIVIAGICTWLQYDYVSETVTVESSATGHANYIGMDGDIYNGQSNSQEAQANP